MTQVSAKVRVVRDSPSGRWRHLGAATTRLLTATVGGYGVASLSAMMLARLLPGGPAEAAIWGTILSFAVLAGVVVWTYAAATAWRAFWVVSLAGAIAGGVTWASILIWGRA